MPDSEGLDVELLEGLGNILPRIVQLCGFQFREIRTFGQELRNIKGVRLVEDHLGCQGGFCGGNLGICPLEMI